MLNVRNGSKSGLRLGCLQWVESGPSDGLDLYSSNNTDAEQPASMVILDNDILLDQLATTFDVFSDKVARGANGVRLHGCQILEVAALLLWNALSAALKVKVVVCIRF